MLDGNQAPPPTPNQAVKMKSAVRRWLLRLGSNLPEAFLRKSCNLLGEMELINWMSGQGMRFDHQVTRRQDLFEMIAAEVGQLPTLYLEFGVAAGDSIRTWSKLLKHPDSCLHGFDSFEGLPEAWGDCPKGTFSTGGAMPQIDDPRVRFFKGWFEETLPTYEPPQRDVIVLNLDADLYSSTILVLRQLRALIRAGTYLYFDEFFSLGHEERAFREFVEESGTKFRAVSTTRTDSAAVFQCIGARSPS